MPNGRRLKKRPLATTRRSTSAGTFGRCSRLCPLRRSLSSQRIAPGQDAPSTRPKGRAHETPERVALPPSQPHAVRSATCAWLHRGGLAAYPPNSDGHPMANTKGHESSIRRSRTLPPLYGSSQLLGGRAHMYHARIACQVRATLAPLAANGRPMRTPKSRFAVAHGRPRAHSLAQRQHPSRSPHERLEPSAPCGRESNRERVGPTPTRRVRRRRATHRFIGSNRIWPALPAALGASGPSFLQDVLESHAKPGVRMGGASGCGFLRYGMHVRPS